MLRFVPAAPGRGTTAVPASVFVTMPFAPARQGPPAGASTPRPPDRSAEASRLSWVSPPQDPAPGLGLTQGSLPMLGGSWRQRGGVLSTKQNRPFAEHSWGLLHRAGLFILRSLLLRFCGGSQGLCPPVYWLQTLGAQGPLILV